MQFEKGRKKTGGRRKGSPGTVRASVNAADACRAMGVNPFGVLAEMATGKRGPKYILAAAETLCRYLQPQLKAVEMQTRVDPAEVIAKLRADPAARQRIREWLDEAEREPAYRSLS